MIYVHLFERALAGALFLVSLSLSLSLSLFLLFCFFQVLAVLLAAVSGTGLAGCLIKCLTKWLYRRFRRGATHLLPTHITDPRAGGPHLDETTIREAPRPAPRAPPPASDVEEAGRQYEDENSADYRDACCCDEIVSKKQLVLFSF